MTTGLARRLPEAAPLHATARNPARSTLGPAVCAVMRDLYGVEPMPWQRDGLDVALEVDPATGGLWYRHVVETVPRQQGKTTKLRAVGTHRLLFRPGQTVCGTAQDLRAALRLWRGVAERLERPPLRERLGVKVRRAAGDEQIALANGSEYLVAAPTEKAGHGLTLHLGLVDEAWSLADMRLAQGFEPATIAAEDSQVWIVSTAGTADSVYLRHWVDLGRRGDHDRLAYLEYGAGPDQDPADPRTWAEANPALGYTVTLDALADLFATMDLADFERAHLNRWTHSVAHTLPPAWWASAAAPLLKLDPTPGTLALAAEVSLDRSAGALCLAGTLIVDGRPLVLVELVDHRPGVEWLADRATELVRKWKPPGGIVIGRGGPAGALIDTLTARRVAVRAVGAGEIANASGMLYDALAPDARTPFRHRAQAALDLAAASAVRRPLAERWTFSHGRQAADISPLMAAALAHWAHATRPTGSGVLVAAG